MAKIPNVLTIAGSDSGGGAGIQADLKTISALGAYGLSVITAITAQNTKGVTAVETVSSALIEEQMKAVFTDIDITAVKIGMLGDVETINAISNMLDIYNPELLVLDPVMVATSGDRLLEQEAIEQLKEILFKRSTIVTPNLYEAEVLLGGDKITSNQEVEKAAHELSERYSCSVLLKGGHFNESSNQSNDFLVTKEVSKWVLGERVNTNNTHGTGCTLSSAIATYLALGNTLFESVTLAKAYIQRAIERSDDLNVGLGNGPVKHFY